MLDPPPVGLLVGQQSLTHRGPNHVIPGPTWNLQETPQTIRDPTSNRFGDCYKGVLS